VVLGFGGFIGLVGFAGFAGFDGGVWILLYCHFRRTAV